MKIIVMGMGYVGLSNAVLLAQSNEVVGIEIDPVKVDQMCIRDSFKGNIFAFESLKIEFV